MKDILQKLIAFPTVTGDAYAMHQLLDYVADFVSKRGMHVEWFESNGFESIVATTQPGRKTSKVMLAAHADVVPAVEESQFDMYEKDGKYYGRGVLDMKAALAAYLQIIDDIKDEIEQYDLSLVVTGDEEGGGRNGMAKLVEEGYLPEVCILPDGGEDWQVQVMAKGFWAFDIAATGKAAHGSRPWLGENAVDKLTAPLQEIRALFPDPKDMGLDTNTLTLARIQAGIDKVYNQVPDQASMTLDIRTISSDEHRRIFDEVTAICQKYDLSYSIPADGWPTAFDLEHPLIEPFVKLVEEITSVSVSGSKTPGSSDVRFLAPHGVQCISFYPTGAGHHGPEEWISAPAFEQMKIVIARYLETIAR